jgi:DNA-binding beta-propeller fold protein YncE
VLIADKGNNRLLEIDPYGRVMWRFPRPGDLAPGQTFQVPDDAFFDPSGRSIVATQEDDFVISVIDVRHHRIAYRYGTPGVPGSTADRLYSPDDALPLPGGRIITADIKNCRLLVLHPPSHSPVRQLGITGGCIHDPPDSFGAPNGAFPASNGDTIVTEITGDWVDLLAPSGRLTTAVHPPGFTYPSDTNELRPGVFLSVDYTSPGVIETFDPNGRVLWRFAPSGARALDHPSLAIPLPNGDILANDDYNDRVIVVDPTTNRIVWQYGHTGRPGSGPGFLNTPDGVDLSPPNDLLSRFPRAVAPR